MQISLHVVRQSTIHSYYKHNTFHIVLSLPTVAPLPTVMVFDKDDKDDVDAELADSENVFFKLMETKILPVTDVDLATEVMGALICVR